ncbi:cytochrome c oxidase polypeptide 4 [Nocardioides baekrokdamisoli]|uniref:Cytochrome c oxidase polypeptide 4 n=1 Tax=Nocardioides baekrokdamisoli TaxID=1804624 RepID=A0A3G9IGY4_9ACTN|nr:cytochrome c oxidase subunit 4 [Nocardioides baekrokdamisoli]BBH18277.1 cytochrome c oxidase polypeptide 4 [Nocardioides baekrokdamisoli]
MKAEAWMFAACTAFLVLVTPAYWFVTSGSDNRGDWTGTSALVMCTLLVLMITLYLGFHANRMDARPEDRNDADIAEGAGELGFFPPFSWWPLWCALGLSVFTFAAAMKTYWLMIGAAGVGFILLCGWIYEYYRGEFKH